MNENLWNQCTLQFLSPEPVVLTSRLRQLTQKDLNMRRQGKSWEAFAEYAMLIYANLVLATLV